MIQVAQSGATRILLADSSPSDVRLIRYALSSEQTWQTEVTVVTDGDQVIRRLESENPVNQEFRTNLVLLDLDLGKRNAIDVLRYIRSHFALQTLPVIILSSLPEGVLARRLGQEPIQPDGFFSKPGDALASIGLGPRLRQVYEKRHMANYAFR